MLALHERQTRDAFDLCVGLMISQIIMLPVTKRKGGKRERERGVATMLSETICQPGQSHIVVEMWTALSSRAGCLAID